MPCFLLQAGNNAIYLAEYWRPEDKLEAKANAPKIVELLVRGPVTHARTRHRVFATRSSVYSRRLRKLHK
jgi:hypothetical protein